MGSQGKVNSSVLGTCAVTRPSRLGLATVHSSLSWFPISSSQSQPSAIHMSSAERELHSPSPATAYRILDANFNRCSEGLRVMEEYVRFVLEDAHLSAVCKQLRHDLITLLGQVPANWLHAMRDVTGDVGTTISTESEYQRINVKEVASANVKRVEQSLRSMEEYAKVVSPQLAAGLESLRYRTYTLERAMSVLGTSCQRLAIARLYVLIDGRATVEAFRDLVMSLLESGVDVLQLRDKQLTDRALLLRARLLRELTRNSDTLFIMNDRVDLAMASGAEGVHLGQDELPVSAARRLLGPEALIGVSTHKMEQARQAVLDGADYLGCGPTFPSATKSFSQFPGLEYLRQVSQEISLPAFAVGGIDGENLTQVLQAGFSRVAVSHSVVGMPDPAHAAQGLAAQLRDACGGG